VPGPPLNLKYSLDRLLIEDITANAVYGICGVTNHRTVTEFIRYPGDQARLRIVRVDRKQHISSYVTLA
jgi:hypothetical protein